MKIYEEKWLIVKKGNGKYYCRYANRHVAEYWPWDNGEHSTLEEAKSALFARKRIFEEKRNLNTEEVVFELNGSI